MRSRVWQIAALTAALLVMVFITACCASQLSAKARRGHVREAEALIKRGDYEGAVNRLEPVYASWPDDEVLVRAFFDILLKAGDYERAEQVMRRYLASRPDDARGLAGLATLHFRTGDDEKAEALIDEIVKLAPREAWSYELAFQVLRDEGKAMPALELVYRGREALGDSTLLAVDAARIHTQAKAYASAASEYLRAAGGGLIDAEDAAERIIQLAEEPEARPSVMQALRRARDVPALEITAGRALWEIHLMDGRCDSALVELSILAQRQEPLARFLPLFASRAREQGCHLECSEAYRVAAQLAKSKADVAIYLLEKAKCEAEGGLSQRALRTYEDIATQYARSKWGDEALLEMGNIYRDLDRFEEAVSCADKVIAAGNGGTVGYGAVLLKGDCMVKMGQMDEAYATYDLVGTDWKPEYAQEAFYNLGEIKFYQAEFDEALGYYNVTLRQYPDEPRANDAIDRIMLLRESKAGETYIPQLSDLSRAILFKAQGKLEDAFALFEMLAREEAHGAIRVESLRHMSEVYLDRGLSDQAIRTYRVIAESLDSHFSPSALEAVGDIYLDLGQTQEAVHVYEEVILRFPDSVEAGEARRKIDITKSQPAGES